MRLGHRRAGRVCGSPACRTSAELDSRCRGQYLYRPTCRGNALCDRGLGRTHDIDALGSTLAYCDIVVAVKAVASHVLRTGLAERLQTVVLSRVPDLVPFLG